MASVVRVENLTKTYGTLETPVIKGVNLTIEQGEFVAIMGPSGSGKSTLMHLMGGLDRPTKGEVYIGDRRLGDLSDKELSRHRRRTIGFIFQFYNLLPVLSARDNVAMPLILDRIRRSEALKRADDMLKAVGLADRATALPNQLSGGEQQRVAIARALVSNPSLILADEPTGALDTRTGDEIIALLKRIIDQLNRTVVMVTHDPRVAANARRIIYLRDGEIVDDNHVARSVGGGGMVADRVRAEMRR